MPFTLAFALFKATSSNLLDIGFTHVLSSLQDLLDSVDGYKDQYDSTLDCGELVLKEPSIESNEKEKVEKDLISLKERWRAIGQNIESIVSR